MDIKSRVLAASDWFDAQVDFVKKTPKKTGTESNNTIYVYVVSAGDTGPYKVGITHSIEARICGLQTSNMRQIKVHALFKAVDAGACRLIETSVHRRLADRRVRGEWFDHPLHEVIATVCEIGGVGTAKPLAERVG